VQTKKTKTHTGYLMCLYNNALKNTVIIQRHIRVQGKPRHIIKRWISRYKRILRARYKYLLCVYVYVLIFHMGR
jgi:hypothetical protein